MQQQGTADYPRNITSAPITCSYSRGRKIVRARCSCSRTTTRSVFIGSMTSQKPSSSSPELSEATAAVVPIFLPIPVWLHATESFYKKLNGIAKQYGLSRYEALRRGLDALLRGHQIKTSRLKKAIWSLGQSEVNGANRRRAARFLAHRYRRRCRQLEIQAERPLALHNDYVAFQPPFDHSFRKAAPCGSQTNKHSRESM